MAALCGFYGAFTFASLHDVTLAEFRALVDVMEEARGGQ